MLRLWKPLVEFVPLREVVRKDEKINLSNPEILHPLEFHPKVVSLSEAEIRLSLELKFRKIIKIKEGLRVQLTLQGGDRLYYLEGEIIKCIDKPLSELVVKVLPRIMAVQRRLFYRFDLKKKLR